MVVVFEYNHKIVLWYDTVNNAKKQEQDIERMESIHKVKYQYLTATKAFI